MRAAFLASAILLVPAAAMAQSQNEALGRIDIIGEAPSACLISAAPTAQGSNATLDGANQNGAEVRIATMVDPATAQVQAANINLALPIICNASHRLTVRTANGGLARLGAPQPAPGFRELVPYTVTASWAGLTQSGSSQAAPSINIESTDGAAGSLNLDIAVPPGGDPLVAGDYQDELIIELQVAS